ncbi:TnsA endonuclease N-terminal domain-containing protein [Lentzea sp. NPDC051838]|uniref:TnsA endonuclease N-terminal domain-containing protein n=1 Tax=Lentzea sp. NPDC051838 TaxID=3154849 RepID=UPI003429A7C7
MISGGSSPRGGKRWSENEEDELLREVRDTFTATEIAQRHGRSVLSISARVATLVRDVREFDRHETDGYLHAFEWAREELRKRAEGLLAAHNDRADRATGRQFTEEKPAVQRSLSEHWVPTATPDEITGAWASITGQTTGFPHGAAEIGVLARVEREVLLETGRRLHHTCGRLTLSDWVVECDWPNVELLRITATQVRDQADEVRWTGAELLRAGLTRVRRGDRLLLLERLGLEGEGTTLAAIGERYGITGERVRQRQTRALRTLRTREPGKVFRAWDHVHGALLAALTGDDGVLDPDLVLSFVDLAVPLAPQSEATRAVAALCGCSTAEGQELAVRVKEVAQRRETERLAELREEKWLGRLNARVQFLVENTDWPAGAEEPLLGHDLHPLRSPRADGRGESGEWFARSLNRDVSFESGVELWFVQRLDASTLVRTFCEQPLAIPYRLYGNERTYYPDFVVDLADGRRLVVELKASAVDFALYENVVKFAAATDFCRARGWGFAATDGYRTPADLLRKEVVAAKEDAVVAAVQGGVTDWPSIRALMLRHHITHAELAALVLRHGWCWHTQPYRLSTSPLGRGSR